MARIDFEAHFVTSDYVQAMEGNTGYPLYLHPTVPAMPQLRTYGFALAGAPFGFGIETSTCIMRLIYSGVFDRYPQLKVILGHLGEGLPALMQRVDFAYVRPWFDPDARPDLKREPSDYLRENMFVTTSGNYLPAAFTCAYESMGIDRILLATDYPYEDSGECVRFLEGLPITGEDRDKIYFRNAGRLGLRRATLSREGADQRLQRQGRHGKDSQ